MCLLPCVPVGQVLLLRPMGAESDDYESVTAEEEEERDASPPPPAGVTPKAKAIIPPRAPSMPPPTHGAYVKAVKDEKLSSSPSVSPAPARRHRPPRVDSEAESSSPPKPASSRPGPAKTSRKWVDRPTCDICWLPVSPNPSSMDQHRRWNLQCLQWQQWNTGRCASWQEAGDKAVRQKARREARAIRQQADAYTGGGGKAVEPPAVPAGHKEPDRDRRRRRHTTDEKKKKEKKHRSVRDPTPEVARPERHRRRRPPSSDSEEPQPRRSKRPRQLIITLPPDVRI